MSFTGIAGNHTLFINMNIRNIFFDLGGVLFNLNTRLSLRRFAELGMPVPDDILSNNAPFNASPEGHPIFQLIHKVDLGEIMGPEFLTIVRSQCREGITDEQVLEAYNGLIDVPLRRLELLERLRGQYRLFLVSNIGDLHWQAACEMAQALGYDLARLFERCFLSYEMHLAKPDPAYFQYAIRESGINPAETLYVDDSPANIAVGREAGLQTLLVEPNKLEEYLKI